MIKIGVTPRSFRIETLPHLILKGVGISIYEYVKTFNELKWDHLRRTMVIQRHYYYRNPTDGMLFLPKYDLPRFLHFLKSRKVEYEMVPIQPTVGKEVDIPIQSWYSPKNTLQKEAIEYVVNGTGYVRGLSLQPGAGKTSISLISAAKLGKRTLIKTPLLVNQWLEAIFKFLCLTENDVYIISGRESVMTLLNEIDKTIFPKIILSSLQTLRPYAQKEFPYDQFIPIENFTDHVGIGTVISDEVHLHFHTNLMLDLMLNPAVSIPMTATYEVTEKQILPIFNGHFPKSIRFGEDRYEKYVIVNSYTYHLPSSRLARNGYKTHTGYNHSLFEKDLLKKKDLMNKIIENVYYPILEREYFNECLPDEKLLIICSTVEMCKKLTLTLREDFKDKVINMFVAGTQERVKEESDILIATAKSAAVGFDVPRLLTTFVTIPIDSPPLNKQLLGRLRKIDNRSPRLCYAACVELDSHRKYTQTRAHIFPPLAREFHEVKLR